MISSSCSLKPISNSLSASSNTTYCRECSLSSISTRTWRNRPGVATILEREGGREGGKEGGRENGHMYNGIEISNCGSLTRIVEPK